MGGGGGGALWKGLCIAKRIAVKEKTVFDVFNFKQDLNQHEKRMNGYKPWWWRRQGRWQRWCRSQSTSDASSAEVANAK